MKLHFEPNLDYQWQAIEAVCDLFRGQEICRTEFTVTREVKPDQMTMLFAQSDLGIGNRLTLLDDELLKNLNDVQLRNGLAPSPSLESGDFTVEMETGTGKTYVYLKTVFELNRRYGFTKFVVVVPSVAIKEGVYKSLQIMEEHFRSLYANTPFEYFLYDSTKLGQVRSFASSSNIQIMVVTVGAINKQEVNNIYGKGVNEPTGGEKPIDLIRATRPILIIDEPQSVDGGLKGRGKEALDAMSPLCTLRYSATHIVKHNMVYRLDAIDAYERKLVKEIEVASASIEGAHNRPYVRLVSVQSRRGVITAKVELDMQTATGVQRRDVTVEDKNDLEQITGRAVYHDCSIGEIRVEKGNEFLELRVPAGEHFLKPGEVYGQVDTLAIQREMIRRTIKEHLDKEKRLRPQGIKVLSLFFIDAVEKYRQYDQDGNAVKGPYAKIFEEEYKRFASHPDYQTLFREVDLSATVQDVHNGYFSIDKKGGWTDTEENNQANRDSAERAYSLIMRDKEKLLSFETSLKFIFSHSALREGWDNPNVFQICALREMGSERQRRQTIGRGLRLCVNQQGDRLRGFEINTLTVVANEKYEQFAKELQTEIETETGIRFGIVEEHQFAGLSFKASDGILAPLGVEKSKELQNYLQTEGYVDTRGKVQDKLKEALKNNTFVVPPQFAAILPQVKDVLRKLSGRLEIRNADERRQVKTRQAVLHSPEFKALWDRIKHKTTYRVMFDNESLIQTCIAAINEIVVAKTRLEWRKADIAIGKAGVEATQTMASAPVVLDEQDIELPDLLTDLQDKTQMTRKSIVRILKESGRLNEFKRNPQEFIERAAEAITRAKRMALVDGIKYQRLGDEEYFAQELFEKEELTGYLKNMLLDVQRSVYEHVIYGSDTERTFAEQLEGNEAIKVYAKLPGWFKVQTPLGSYNPDWAVLVEKNGGERLYFVVETKASLFTDDLRDRESKKIECGKAHFKALAVGGDPARYEVATGLSELLAKV